jgi:hypothetical protein
MLLELQRLFKVAVHYLQLVLKELIPRFRTSYPWPSLSETGDS